MPMSRFAHIKHSTLEVAIENLIFSTSPNNENINLLNTFANGLKTDSSKSSSNNGSNNNGKHDTKNETKSDEKDNINDGEKNNVFKCGCDKQVCFKFKGTYRYYFSLFHPIVCYAPSPFPLILLFFFNPFYSETYCYISIILISYM